MPTTTRPHPHHSPAPRPRAPRSGRRLRTLVALTAGSLALAAVLPAAASAVPGAHAPSAAGRLPPVNPVALQRSLAGLPNQGITGALLSVSGTGGGWRGASGAADLATGRAANPDMTFRIGSVTKVFTAVVVLQLVAEHHVDLDTPVQHYLPGVLPADFPPVTVAQLLDHTSGLPGGTTDDGEDDPAAFVEQRFGHPTPAQVVAEMDGQPMTFAPGTQQQYNGENYYLLGMLVEKVTGRSYAREVTDRVLRPLRLRDTEVPAATDYRVRGRHLHGYLAVTKDGVTTPADVTEQSPYPWAEGGMTSSTRDLATVLTAAMDGRLLPPAQREDLFTVPDVPYHDATHCLTGEPGRACFSMGLMSTTVDGVTVWGKTGSRPGYTDGVFATRDLSRVLVYAFTPTSDTDPYMAFILGIAQAALAGTDAGTTPAAAGQRPSAG